MTSFKFIGWCNDGNHDKVWGVIFLESPKDEFNKGFHYPTHLKCVTFWGRRGKKLQTKASVDDHQMFTLINRKLDKGYSRVNIKKLDEVYPEFQTDLEETAFWATLKG